MLAVLPEAAVMIAADGSVEALNAAAEGLFPAMRVGGLASAAIRNPEFQVLLAETAQPGDRSEVTLVQRVPHERRLALTAGVLNLEGRPDPVRLITIRDLSERDRLDRMRTDFIANASHELRTPLAAVRGFIETLQGPARDDPAARKKFLAIMAREAGRMQRLIDDLLRLSRVEMHEHIRPAADVDLAALAAAVVASMEPLAAAVPARLTLAAGGPAMVRGDADELTQVIQNLVQNALRHGRVEGDVRVQVSPAAGSSPRVTLSVADDGPGVAAEHIPRLTERFYRVEGKTGRDSAGTGLGLAIVKHIVVRHGGELFVQSVPGQGTTFSVHLPQS